MFSCATITGMLQKPDHYRDAKHTYYKEQVQQMTDADNDDDDGGGDDDETPRERRRRLRC